MNKIYKVIWSKARSCYVAVSELANAHSKGSKGARALLASALLLGAGLMPLFTTELDAAYTATGTSKGQYTVYQTDASAANTTTQEWDGEKYTYTKQTLTNPDNDEKVYVYVRNGYTAALVEGKRFSSAEVNYKIMAYQTDMSADTAAGLLYTDTVNGTIGSETLTEGGIKDVAVTMYTGGVIGENDTPYNWNYYIQDTDGTWVDGGSMGKNRFVTVTANEQGMYTYNGELLENSYIYVLKKNKTYQIGVFVNDKGHLYKGNVYGKHNEILKTAVDENNNIYSFWGAENDDPNVLLSQSNMTIGELNSALGALVTNVRTAQGDDIQKVTASQTTGKENSGTISLMRRGQYDATTGKYTGDYAVDGTLQLTSDGGTEGNDVKLHVQQAGTDGNFTDAFTLAAGSKVEALGDSDATLSEGDTVKKIKINGISYNIVDTDTTYTAGDGTITIDKDNHTIKANSSTIIKNAKTDIQTIAKGAVKVAAGTNVTLDEATDTATGAVTYTVNATDTKLSTATSTTNDKGAVTWTISDTSGKSVTLTDLASHTDLSNLSSTVNTHYTTLSNNDIKSGSIGNDGKVTLTKNDNTTIEVGTVKDYSVTSGVYNSDGKKIALTKKNAYSDDTATVDIDLTALENKMGSLTNITTEGKTQITNLIDVKAGDNITSVTSKTDENGVKTFTVNAKDTTYTAGDNITIDKDNRISAKDTTLSTATKTKATDGAVTWTITDTDNNSVTLDDLASHTDLSNLTTTVSTNYTTLSNNDIKSGSIGTDGKVTLTKNDGNTIEVGTVKDYSVTSGAYDSANKKITLTKKNAYSDDTATVDIDLTALENKMGSLTNITTEGKTQITNLIDVKAGDNITSVTSKTDENGVKTFTVNAKDTTYTAGDDTITIDATNHTIKANSSTIIQTAKTDIQTIAKGAVKVAAGTNVTLGEGTDATGAMVYTINAKVTTYTAGDNITIDTDNKISAKDTTLSKAEKSGGTNSAVTWTITDTAGKSVTLEGLASYTDLSNLSTTVSNNYTTLNNNDIESGSISDTGKVTLTKKDGKTIDVGTVQDYSVTSGVYDSDGKKITLTKTNAYGGATSTFDIDLTELENKISDSSSTIAQGFSLIGTTEDSKATTKNLGEAITVDGANGIVVSSTDGEDGKVTVSLDSTITVGKADKKGEDGKPGEAGEQGHIGLAGKDGTNGKDGTTLVDIRTETGKPGLDGKDGEDGITRIIYEDGKGDHQVATLDDGLKFAGDSGDTIKKNLNEILTIQGGATGTLTEGNIGVISDGKVLTVKLANALNGITSITGNGTTISLNSGNVTINGGLKVSGQITGVTAGTADTDAVNVSQLNAAKADISTLDKGAVKYDKNGDTYDYSKVTMGGTTYTTDKTGGTIITNVAYSTGNKSDAVNVQYLEDKIAASQGSMTAAEKHIKEDTYFVTGDKVTLEQVNGEGTKTGEVIISDVAKASELGKLNSTTETHKEGKEDGILKDSLKNTEKDDQGNTKTTTMADVANKLDDKIDDVSGKVTTLEKTVETYQTTTNEKLTKIEQSIVDANANHTALTVNGGEAATADGNQKGNLQLKVTTDNGKSTYDVKLSDTVVLGKDSNAITLDGTEGKATISKELTVGDITMKELDLGTYTKDVGDHKKGDTLKGYSVTGLANTTTHYEKFADGTGKAATEEQLKEALGAMDFQDTVTKDGETVNKYNIVNNATNVTEAIYAIDQNLTDANARIENNAINIQNLSSSLGKLNTRVNRVGAGAAALAALHPLDFDPDDKWDFAAGYGNYAGANATSIGAYYRPNEDTMFSVAGSFGGGENMVNAGVSFKLGQGNHVTTSRVAMAKEIKALRATVEEQSEQNAALSATVEAQGKQIAALTALVEKLTGEKVETPEAEKNDA